MSRFIKIFWAILSIFVATSLSAATPDSVSVSPAERAKIETVVHQYLVQHPEVLMEAIQVLRQKQYEEAEQTVKKTQQSASKFVNALFHESNDPVAGNAKGQITVVEFFDYQCPHCIDMAPVIDGIIKTNSNVRIVFKDFPIRGPISELAARAAIAANKQGKYYEFSHALLTAKQQPLTQEAIFDIATSVGLNVDQLKKEMSNKTTSAQLKANFELAQALKLFGTPAFFIGKTDAKNSSSISYVPGQMNQSQLQEAIDKVNE